MQLLNASLLLAALASSAFAAPEQAGTTDVGQDGGHFRSYIVHYGPNHHYTKKYNRRGLEDAEEVEGPALELLKRDEAVASKGNKRYNKKYNGLYNRNYVNKYNRNYPRDLQAVDGEESVEELVKRDEADAGKGNKRYNKKYNGLYNRNYVNKYNRKYPRDLQAVDGEESVEDLVKRDEGVANKGNSKYNSKYNGLYNRNYVNKYNRHYPRGLGEAEVEESAEDLVKRDEAEGSKHPYHRKYVRKYNKYD